MTNIAKKLNKRRLRARRVRAKVKGSKLRPRLSVFRSNQHIYAQLINDDKASTIISISDSLLDKKLIKGKKKTEIARLVGKNLGEKAKKAGVKTIVFDRGGFAYHGRVKAIAEGLREIGIKL